MQTGHFNFAFLLLVSIAILGLAIWASVYSLRQYSHWPKVRGTVVGYEDRKGDEGRHYHPLLEFSTNDETRVSTVSSFGTWRHPWAIGTQVSCVTTPKIRNVLSYRASPALLACR
jgi:hypothetical protein